MIEVQMQMQRMLGRLVENQPYGDDASEFGNAFFDIESGVTVASVFSTDCFVPAVAILILRDFASMVQISLTGLNDNPASVSMFC